MVQLVLDQPRLHARPQLLAVDLQHLAHVLGEVEDEGVIDRLAGQRGAPAARQQRHLVRPRNVDRGPHVVGVARGDHADRLHLVHGGVGGVQQPRGGVEADVAPHDTSQGVLEVVHARHYTA
jgi:hypothetical protein